MHKFFFWIFFFCRIVCFGWALILIAESETATLKQKSIEQLEEEWSTWMQTSFSGVDDLYFFILEFNGNPSSFSISSENEREDYIRLDVSEHPFSNPK